MSFPPPPPPNLLALARPFGTSQRGGGEVVRPGSTGDDGMMEIRTRLYRPAPQQDEALRRLVEIPMPDGSRHLTRDWRTEQELHPATGRPPEFAAVVPPSPFKPAIQVRLPRRLVGDPALASTHMRHDAIVGMSRWLEQVDRSLQLYLRQTVPTQLPAGFAPEMVGVVVQKLLPDCLALVVGQVGQSFTRQGLNALKAQVDSLVAGYLQTLWPTQFDWQADPDHCRMRDELLTQGVTRALLGMGRGIRQADVQLLKHVVGPALEAALQQEAAEFGGTPLATDEERLQHLDRVVFLSSLHEPCLEPLPRESAAGRLAHPADERQQDEPEAEPASGPR